MQQTVGCFFCFFPLHMQKMIAVEEIVVSDEFIFEESILDFCGHHNVTFCALKVVVGTNQERYQQRQRHQRQAGNDFQSGGDAHDGLPDSVDCSGFDRLEAVLINEVGVVGHQGLLGQLVFHGTARFILQRDQQCPVECHPKSEGIRYFTHQFFVNFRCCSHDRMRLIRMIFLEFLCLEKCMQKTFNSLRVVVDEILLGGNIEGFGVNVPIVKNQPTGTKCLLDLG